MATKQPTSASAGTPMSAVCPMTDTVSIKIQKEITLELPIVIKPNQQGSTFGLTVVKDQKQLAPALNKAFQC